jgi:hypothetical protein
MSKTPACQKELLEIIEPYFLSILVLVLNALINADLQLLPKAVACKLLTTCMSGIAKIKQTTHPRQRRE